MSERSVGTRVHNGLLVLVLVLPLVIAVGGGMVTLSLALGHGDAPLPLATQKKGPIQFGTAQAALVAHEAGIRARLRWQGNEVVAEVDGADAAELQLRLWHRTGALDDRVVRLSRMPTGEYRAALNRPVGDAWIALLTPVDMAWAVQGNLHDGAHLEAAL
jgi:hypothetical protein